MVKAKKIFFLVALVFGIVVIFLGFRYIRQYFALGSTTLLEQGIPVFPTPVVEDINQAHRPVVSATEVAYELETVITNLDVPWDFVFLPDGEILIAERTGAIRLFANGVIQLQPVFVAPDLTSESEAGLMGILLAPDYQETKQLYACWVYRDQGMLYNKVVRLIFENTEFVIDRTIIDGIPSARFHAGCRIAFGPDGKLYITTGDASEKRTAQDIDNLGGKILRLEPDGSIPIDNPFAENPVFSYGHRNPQGLDWHPKYEYLISTEHGPSVFDGPAGGDEVNWVQAGHNYGWPLVSHTQTLPGMDDPLLVFTPAEAPASGSFYTGTAFPEFQDNFFFGALRGEGIIRVVFADSPTPSVSMYEKLPGIAVGRIRTVKAGPDGALYFVTSNRDGRGTVRAQDDVLMKIIPVR